MILTRHRTENGPRWAVDGQLLPEAYTLSGLLARTRAAMQAALAEAAREGEASAPLLAPVDGWHEIWACGVTYLRSRDARQAESTAGDVYARVYEAERPELFFKSTGWRAVGHGETVRIRTDSTWDVPEPELTLVVNSQLEIVGYTAGNDVSSRSIEGENPLYLPQAKTYTGACAVGPGIVLCDVEPLRSIAIALEIVRDGAVAFSGETSSARMKRGLEELVGYLGRATSFPVGALLMTGTGLVPPDDFTLATGDTVRISVGSQTLENIVAR